MNFNKIVDKTGTDNVKHNRLREKFGSNKIIPMWVADMDFKSPKKIIRALRNKSNEGVFGYVYNDDEIYRSICQWQKKRYGWEIKKDSVFLANGVVSSIAFIINAFTKRGDGIIIQTPVYHPFARVIKENKRVVKANPLIIKNDKFEIDFKDLQKKAKQARIMILCNPHNPTGKVYTKKELLKIAEICLKNDILIVSDEIHSDFVYNNKRHTPIASLSKKISDQTITLNAASKSFNVAGLMTSYVVCENNKIAYKYKRYLQKFEKSDNNIFGTIALQTAYKSCGKWLDELVAYLEANRDFAYDYIKENIPAVNVFKPEATYLLWIDFRGLGLSPNELEKFLVQKAKLGLNNGIVFGKEGRGFARMNIATQKKTLKEALENLKKAIVKL